jgi:hypothetical protein
MVDVGSKKPWSLDDLKKKWTEIVDKSGERSLQYDRGNDENFGRLGAYN